MTQDNFSARAGVSAPNRLAAQAGARILRCSGTALEAAVATAAALAVVYPHMNSIGGDSFWLIRRRGEKPVAIRACGQAAAVADTAFYLARGYKSVPSRGPLATLTVPGTIRGWEALLNLRDAKGRLPLKTILADAIAWARDGFPVSASQARTTAASLAGLKNCPGFARVFLKEDGTAPCRGDVLKQPALARTLQMLAERGLADFYEGETAERICAELRALGSPLSESDFAAARAQQVEPLHLKAFGCDFYNLPEPTQGAASLAILGLMERAGADPSDLVGFVHSAVEAAKLAFEWRNRHVGDPRAMTVSTQAFLSDESLTTLFKSFDSASARPFGQKEAEGDTVWFGAADNEGTVVSCIQSIYWEYGSGVVLEDTGITMQNRGCAFTFDSSSPNCLRPGALPFHTLNPALAVLGDGRTIAYGTMGGEGQPQTQAAVILRHLSGMPLDRAIREPRWLIGRTWGDETAKLRLEPRFAPEVVEKLKAMGHDVEVLSEVFSDTMGHAGAVSLAVDGTVTGASDPRSDGAFEAA